MQQKKLSLQLNAIKHCFTALVFGRQEGHLPCAIDSQRLCSRKKAVGETS